MNWRNIKLIFLREVRDQLRDRRTLFMVAVLPLLLYPILGIAMVNMTVTFSEQTRTVVMLGADDLPDPPLLDGDRFVADYFENPDDAAKLTVVTDRTPATALDPEIAGFLEQAREIRPHIEELARATADLRGLERAARTEPPVPEVAQAAETLRLRSEELRSQIGDWFNRSPVQVLIVIPTGYRDRMNALNAQLANRDPQFTAAPAEQPIILENGAVDKSAIAFRRVREALRNWEEKLLEQRLQQANLPESLHTPFNPTDVNLAEEDQIAASVWSKLFPALLVIMSITGAFYPAIDVGAGEKERGTMETLLICPASRTEIVTGKFLTVLLFSLATAFLNLLSMGFTGKYTLEMAGGAASALGNVSLPPPSALVWLIVLAVPLAALFSALSLAFAMFARSSKEGQYYLTPLLMVTIGLTLFCLNPAVEITPYYSVLPVMGPALLLKALLLGATASVPLSIYFAPVLLSSFAYSALALWWAIELFRREAILFREADRLELGLWLRHVLRDKAPLPNFTEAGICFLMIMLLQFASYSPMQQAFFAAPEGSRVVKLLELQMIFLLATVATPALIMAAVLTTDFRRTLKLCWPDWRMLAAGSALACLLLPISQELIRLLEGWFFPALPEGAAQLFAALRDPSIGIWLPLLAFAVAPAICEELAFRGFILSGMQHSGRPWLPIVLSSVAFGVVHMIPQQVFNAILLGLVLGLLAIRSGSLVPGVIFHLLFNGLQVVMSRIDPSPLAQGAGDWLFTIEQAGEQSALRFDWPLIVMCALAAAWLLRWVLRHRPEQSPPTVTTPLLTEGERTTAAV
ncbi:MAG: CPBP family intramembrane metalloprotease [Planctomycetaceae bacterium]|nr:CPBP family intramembrane metalloprotease [Planctomycetaceae bacterium]